MLSWKHGPIIAGVAVVGIAGAVILAQELPIPLGRPTTGNQPEVVIPIPTFRVGSDDVVSPFEPPVIIRPGDVPVTDPCARERAEEARTRAERDSAKTRYDAIEAARKAAQETTANAKDAAAKATKAAKAAGGRWTATAKSGGVTQTRSGWNKAKYGPAADRAQAAADKAAGEKRDAVNAFNRLGDGKAWLEAKSAYDAAQKAWQAAWDALQRCLGQSSGGGVSIPGGGISGGGGGGGGGGSGVVGGIINGPVIGGPVRVIACREGDTKGKSSERITVKLIDLRRAKIRFSSAYQDAADIGGFTDWLEWIKGGFFEGKKVKDLLEGLASGEVPVGGLLDTVGIGLPDFISYYDKMGDEVIGALRKIGEITERVRKAGDYSIRYPTSPYTLTCTTQEVCRNGTWVTERTLEMKRDAGTSWNVTNVEFAPNADAAKAIIEKLFRQLENKNRPEVQKMEEFEKKCNG
ncbi:hypothetical protein HY635_00570 [Candidatus Uhrbacteria bacterium]|nr:hypothetical protein [Candidatus Uhrbacteria bacterium]